MTRQFPAILPGILVLLLPFQAAESKEDAYVDGEVLVTLKTTAQADNGQAALKKHSLQWARRFEAISSQRRRPTGLVRQNGRTTAQLIADLKDDADVETVEPNYIRHVNAATPSDASFSKLWGLSNTGQTVNGTTGVSGVDTNFLAAWKLALPNPSEVVIGVVDTGVDITHPDLAANIWTNPNEIAGNGVDDDGDGYVDDVNGYDFAGSSATITDSGEHGTHVAGTIAAAGQNGIGVIGIDYKAKILPLKVSTDGDSIDTASAIAAINYAVKLKQKGVNIVALNASYGGGSSSTSEKSAIQALSNAGIIFCAAAGNDGANNDSTASYPANYDVANIISVAALDQTNNLASFSNYGSKTVDIAAPGTNIYSTMPLSLASGSTILRIGTATYGAAQIAYSGSTAAAGLSGSLINCGLGNPSEFPTTVKGNIALIQRGTLTFTAKVTNAMSAGAVAVVVYDNVSGSVTGDGGWTLGSSGNWIPALRITKSDGTAVLGKLPTSGTVINFRDSSLAYQFLDGTSMATPHVTGAVGFAAMNFPNDTMAQRIARILNHATPVAALSGKTVTGGRLNLLGIVDTDGDSLPDWWETANLGSLAASGSDDSDGDGDSNLDEFLDGTGPADASSKLAFSALQTVTDSGGQHFVLSFPTVVDRTYEVDWTETLAPDSWTSLGTSVAGTGSVVEVTDPADINTVPKRFYRLHVE